MIYDVKDKDATNDGIVLIGGFVGELIISFTCMLDYILATPANQNFMFTLNDFEKYLLDLLGGEGSEWPAAICQLNLNKPISELKEQIGDDFIQLS